MNTTHTDGPWTAREYGSPRGSFFVRGPNDERIISSGTPLIEANARLIAAAPDMFEALRESVKQLEVIIEDGIQTDWRAWRDDLESVLSKAQVQS